MTTKLKVVMALFYGPTLGLLILQFIRHGDFSAPVIGRWLGLGFVSLVMPLWWTLALGRALRARGLALEGWQLAMPAWCAAATALIATSLFR